MSPGLILFADLGTVANVRIPPPPGGTLMGVGVPRARAVGLKKKKRLSNPRPTFKTQPNPENKKDRGGGHPADGREGVQGHRVSCCCGPFFCLRNAYGGLDQRGKEPLLTPHCGARASAA